MGKKIIKKFQSEWNNSKKRPNKGFKIKARDWTYLPITIKPYEMELEKDDLVLDLLN